MMTRKPGICVNRLSGDCEWYLVIVSSHFSLESASLQSSVTNTTARHSNSQAAHIPSFCTVSVSEFRCLINQLVESWINIICKLYFGNGLHSFRRRPNTKSHNTLFTQRRIEHSLGTIVLCETHTASEHPTKCYVFTKQYDRIIRSHSKGERIIDGLEKVHPLRGPITNFRRKLRVLQSRLGGMRQQRCCGEVGGDVQASLRRVGRVLAMSTGVADIVSYSRGRREERPHR